MGWLPGLPAELVSDIVQRSEGIPLYAVETIRMLLDRGLLVQNGVRHLLTGDVSDLEVPETLHALVASRLDGLSVGARPLLATALLARARRSDDAEALSEARSIYEELGATRWLERLDAELGAVPA